MFVFSGTECAVRLLATENLVHGKEPRSRRPTFLGPLPVQLTMKPHTTYGIVGLTLLSSYQGDYVKFTALNRITAVYGAIIASFLCVTNHCSLH
jgi:hypothetical protein